MKTIKQVEITPVFCEDGVPEIPSQYEEGKVYISKNKDWMAHNCLCDGLECPDCGGCMEQNDTTYSNVNTRRASVGQYTGNIYRCQTCENSWLENFLNNSKMERWSG